MDAYAVVLCSGDPGSNSDSVCINALATFAATAIAVRLAGTGADLQLSGSALSS